ncbi:MAG: hypothetical protein IJ848_01820 [Alphaproteobacteria bacterium]|nr:hypothetical protein [Alphaproteobacteria bacterium]
MKNKAIKWYSICCCLLLLIYNAFNNNIYDVFNYTFSVVIPFICLLCSIWIINKDIYKPKIFCISLILFCILSVLSFTTDNIFLLYAYMEMSFIPMCIMIFSYEKDYDLKIIYQYLFYTLISAIFILIGIIEIYNDTKSVLLSEIYRIGVKSNFPLYMLALGTAIKLPIFPFYYWVPSVHGKSPGVCSVLLSSIVLKFSSLILVKIICPLFNMCSYKYIGYYVSFGMLISVCQMMYKKDLKTVFAYSSVIHMGLYTFILLAGNNVKYFTYSILQHTITMTLSFLVLDLLKNNYKHLAFNKLILTNKHELILLFINTLIIIDFPFTWGFIAETISIFSVIQCDLITTSIVGLALLLYNSYFVYIIFNIFRNSIIDSVNRINILYTVVICILIIPILLFGIAPKLFI